MRWRLTYVVRHSGTTEDETSWRDETRTWNMERVESNQDAQEKVKAFIEDHMRRSISIHSCNLVRVVQEEVTVPVSIPPVRTMSELKLPRKAS